MNNMKNRDERHAYKLLKDLGYNKIKYEPNGHSKFPDMSISDNNGSIAVEVTRLNPYKYIDDQLFCIDGTLTRNLYKFIKKGLENEENNKNYKFKNYILIYLAYKRIKSDKVEKNKLGLSKNTKKEILKTIIRNSKEGRFGEEIKFTLKDKYFEIIVTLYENIEKDYLDSPTFVIGSWHDKDCLFNVNETRVIALKKTIPHKSEKITSEMKNQYNKFWLILVDHIFNRVDRRTIEDLNRIKFNIKSNFDRIILLSKTDIKQRIDLLPYH